MLFFQLNMHVGYFGSMESDRVVLLWSFGVPFLGVD
jgi:hypothetical protein